MSRRSKVAEVQAEVKEEEFVSLKSIFGNKDLLKDGSNLNVKLNIENHYFQHVHRLDPESTHPFYYVITFDGVQYKGGPYKTIYEANKDCAKKLYELYNLDQQDMIIKCEKVKSD